MCIQDSFFCLSNRTTLRFDVLRSFMVCAQTSAFKVQKKKEKKKKKKEKRTSYI